MSPLAAFWHAVTTVDRSKMNSTPMAVRNALATAVPLAIGIATGNPLGGIAVTVGALNVAYADGRDPYAQRARRMLIWSCLGAFAVFTGSVSGETGWAAVLVAALWAFVAGMALSVSTRAGDLGLNTLVTLLVFGARGALSPAGALIAALLALAGGLLQTGFALLSWTIHRHEPEREALGRVYAGLAGDLDPHSGMLASMPLATTTSPQIQETISALGRDHSLEGERDRLLFDQTDRIRMSVYVLGRLKAELERAGSESALRASVDRMFELSSAIAREIANCLTSGQQEEPPLIAEMRSLLDSAHTTNPLEQETAAAMEALAGQLRVAFQMATHATPQGLERFARDEASLPWRLQIRSWSAAVGANLFTGSAIFRHALRLAICVPVADAIGRSIDWQRSYWIPMTVAIVLKPDFITTFSRGALRLSGTLAGLLLATVLYHLLPESPFRQLLLVGAFMFLMRKIGPANYGVFSIAVSGLVVFLLAAAGTSPREAVIARGSDTLAGGIAALIAYALWPTWERKQIFHPIADLIDATRDYFHAVRETLSREETLDRSTLDQKRRLWRRVRSTAEASVDRATAEPGMAAAKTDCLVSMLASLTAIAHSIMGIEAGLARHGSPRKPPPFELFANDVEFTLYFLSEALRGSLAAGATLPKLREDHRRMIDARAEFGPESELLLLESDRLIVALNTLREQTMRYLGLPTEPRTEPRP